MSDLSNKISALHAPVNLPIFRFIAFVLGMGHVGLLMWEPTEYAQAIGGFNSLISPLLILAICSSMIFAIGFHPRKWIWQVLFSPYISLLVLFYLSIAFLM